MYIMYIDESGKEETSDQMQYFLVSGVVIQEKDLQDMYVTVRNIRTTIFPARFQNPEIHVQRIYKGHKDFYGISKDEARKSLDMLYTSLQDINFSTILIVIDKKALLCSPYNDYDVLETAYVFLIERFDKFLQKKERKECSGWIVQAPNSTVSTQKIGGFWISSIG